MPAAAAACADVAQSNSLLAVGALGGVEFGVHGAARGKGAALARCCLAGTVLCVAVQHDAGACAFGGGAGYGHG